MITLTKIKRIAAKYGIGDPLNRLFYTREEIETRKKSGQICAPTPKPRVQSEWERNHKGKYAIQMGYTIVHKAFISYKDAKEWADRNYKGRGNWKIVEL